MGLNEIWEINRLFTAETVSHVKRMRGDGIS